MNFPANLKYTAEHEWVAIDGDIATVGITDFAQSELGDIVFVEIDTVGQQIGRDQVFGTVEAVKTVSDLFMPLSGEILEKNAELDNTPEVLNSDPYQAGWMIKIKISDPAEVDALMSADAYQAHIGQ
jgi:glycine cleavage system H protein